MVKRKNQHLTDRCFDYSLFVIIRSWDEIRTIIAFIRGPFILYSTPPLHFNRKESNENQPRYQLFDHFIERWKIGMEHGREDLNEIPI